MNDERTVTFSAAELDEMIRRGETLTDRERVRNMTDEEVEANINYEDEGRFDLSRARKSVSPFLPDARSSDEEAHPSIAADVIDWFQRRGPDYERQIEDVLRAYIAEQQRQAS